MTTEIEICNLALAKVGTRTTITSFTENSAEADQCALQYAGARDQVLRMAHWGWAKKTARLTLWKSAPGTPTAPPGGGIEWDAAFHPPPPWLYSYRYPEDCLQTRSLVSQVATGITGMPLFSTSMTVYPYTMGPHVRFEIGSDNGLTTINTNQYKAIAQYTYRVTDPNQFDDLFVEALAAAIGAKLVNALAGERSLRRDLFEEANYHIINARARDGNEGLSVIEAEAAWITARSDIAVPAGYWTTPFPPLFATV